jgi:type IV pilus assembly protein PilA
VVVRERGFTLIELLVVIAVIGILAAVAAVGLGRSHRAANEASAIASLRAIRSAEDAFRAVCGHDTSYAVSLPQLGQADVITPNLAESDVVGKSGYVITLTGPADQAAPDACTGRPTATSWYASAVPIRPGFSGSRGFAIDQASGIWQNTDGTAPPAPFAPGPSISSLHQN